MSDPKNEITDDKTLGDICQIDRITLKIQRTYVGGL